MRNTLYDAKSLTCCETTGCLVHANSKDLAVSAASATTTVAEETRTLIRWGEWWTMRCSFGAGEAEPRPISHTASSPYETTRYVYLDARGTAGQLLAGFQSSAQMRLDSVFAFSNA